MKPLEASMVDCDREMECEVQPKDFFVQVGMLIMEGRTPELSNKGRVEGKHCPSLTGMVTHQCDGRAECEEALSRKRQMEFLWLNDKCLIIDVIVKLNGDEETWLLLEQWTVEVVGSASSQLTSCSMLMQAVRSHIHFSQLSAWLSLCKGTQPKHIRYIIRQSGHLSQKYPFIRDPQNHVFPLASLPGHSAVCVMVKSLPRCDLSDLQLKLTELHVVENTCKSEYSNGITRTSPTKTNDTRSPQRKKTYLGKCAAKNDEPYINNGKCSFKKTDNASSASCSQDSNDLALRSCSNGIFNLGARLTELDKTVSRIDKTLDSAECANGFQSKRNKKLETILCTCGPGSTKEDTGLAKMMLDRKARSYSDGGMACKDLRNKSTGCNADSTKINQGCTEAKQNSCNTRHSPTRQGGAQNSCDVDIHAVRHTLDRASLRRSVQLPIGACSEPVFNQRTGLPISSSPAPLRRSTTELDDGTADFTNGLSNRIDYRELAKILSRSAPASTTQSLLGNFEESVLNGRMEPVGAVDGFTAEMSASGSFCPPHVKLPINSYFYRLSDDDAPSPYMGYIRLDDEPIARKGYHVPQKGTIQLTVFNPNKTVVKIFVVLYDFSDMPPQSQTFLRQKTFSVLKQHSLVKTEVQPTLHYLLHLRFASSKSGRIYLHTDIRVIFARQPPDLGTMYRLSTVTDGPTDPKYTPTHHNI